MDEKDKVLYEKCKKIVKQWEFEFTSKKGRIPSKLDIRDADRNIRDAYRTYFRLKTQALMSVIDFDDNPTENTENAHKNLENDETLHENHEIQLENIKMQTENHEMQPENVEAQSEKSEVNVWGKHLNKVKEEEEDEVAAKKETPKVLSNLSKKLFNNSKVFKRNPRRSRSSLNLSSRNNSTFKLETSTVDSENLENTLPTSLLDCSVPIISEQKISLSQPISLTDKILSQNFNLPNRNLDKSWLERASNSFRDPNDSSIFLETDIISDSEDESEVLHLSKKSKLSSEGPQNRSISQESVFRGLNNVSGDSKSVWEDRNIVLQGQNSVSGAQNSVSVAQNSVSGAQNSVSVAQNSVSGAQNSVSVAQNSVFGAQNSVFGAQNSVPVAQNSVSGAQNSVSVAQNSVFGAQNSVFGAQNSVPVAQNSVLVAQNSVFLAQNSVFLAQNSVFQAQNSVSVVQISVSVAQNSLSGAQNSVFEPHKSPLDIQNNVYECSESVLADSKSVSNGTKNGSESQGSCSVPNSVAVSKSDDSHDSHSVDVDEKGPQSVKKTPKTRKKVQKIVSDSESENFSGENEEDDYVPDLKKMRKTRRSKKQSVTNEGTENENTKKRKRQPKATVRSTRTSNRVQKEEIPSETEEYVVEYSIKPPPKTVPRINKLPIRELKKSLEIDANSEKSLEIASVANVKNKKTLKEEKLVQKIKSGTLNENFVRLDMKKKIFVKGKKNLNFSRYKKNLWKSKKKALYGPDMDMGGCDGGEITCFKCGNTGHFARNCKKPEDRLLPLEGYQEEEPSPIISLEEAQKMAQNNLAIFKPNIGTEMDTSDDENPEDQSDSEIPDNSDGFTLDSDLEKFMSEFNFDSINKIDENQQNIDLPSTPLEENVIDNVEKYVQPIYKLNADGSLPDTPKEVFQALSEFGHKGFRSGQEKAVMRILCGQSTLVTLSTGSGKSLCYQLPALIYARKFNCISIVVSPLVSLMDDQVSSADQFLGAACLHAGQTKTQREKVLKMLEQGLVKMLLLSPEAITMGEKSNGFGSILRKLPPIAFACIDEAHCVSQWSHNFRPSYLMICHVLREKLGIKTILGLTATATKATCNSIVQHLQVPDGEDGIISDIPVPGNLSLNISMDLNREGALKKLLESEPYCDFDSIIVYCTRREECERIAGFLRTGLMRENPKLKNANSKFKSVNPIAESYHAGMVASRRRTIQKAFMAGHLRIVVATVAFGMGINKQDLRAVIHYNMPSSFESYVQEVGRAGRDSLPARCHAFLTPDSKDIYELKRHIYANSLDRFTLRKLIEKIFLKCSCKKFCPKHEVSFSIEKTVQDLDLPEENISTLLCYLELDFSKNIEILTPAYTTAKIISYGPFNEILKAAKNCPPLAMALALHPPPKENKTLQFYEFPVVEVASSMGWDSGIVKKRLKQLEWITDGCGKSQRSKISVQFSNLGFRLRAPGNLNPNELDETLDKLYKKVVSQIDTRLKQLEVLNAALQSVAAQNFRLCTENASIELRKKIREYFSSEDPLNNVEVKSSKNYSIEQIASDVRQLVHMYRDNKFNGRNVAKIFQGIQSPKFPAVMWGKCKFWRQYLNVDFEILLKIATQEIQKMR